MQIYIRCSELLRRARPLALVGLTLGILGCGLDAVDIPGVRGPSEQALSIRLVAEPDLVRSNGSAWITAHVRDRDGQPVAGVPLFFRIVEFGGELRPSDAGVTDANGVLGVTYVPGGCCGTARVEVRAIDTDFGNSNTYRWVTIEVVPIF